MDSPRIEDLKRRIQKDPASIAFAQLGEEYRRAGRCKEAIETCRAGLRRHPGYLSARVTLGRALMEVGDLAQAERELEEVLRLAPENLAALRALGETLHQRGASQAALRHYEAALALAPRDPELQQIVESLRTELRPAPPPPEPAPTPVPPALAVLAPLPPTLDDSAPAATTPAVFVQSSDNPPVEPQPAVAALEHWLDLIIADRERRHSAQHAP